MSELLSFANKTKSFSAVSALKRILEDKETQEFIIKLNTRDQLFDKGEDSEGVKLEDIGGEYTTNTIEGVQGLYPGKKQLGLPFDRVTLFQEGDFYKSFRIEVNLPFFTIIADDIKEGVRLTDRWGVDIIGLNDENKDRLCRFLERRVIDSILNFLLS